MWQSGMRRVSVAGIVLFVVASGSQAVLIAHYEAEANAFDSTGDHNGMMENGAGFDTGRFGWAFALDGANDYVSAPDSPAFTFGSGNFSLSTWVNFDSIRSGVAGSLPNVFVGHDEGSTVVNKWVFFYAGDGLGFHINGGGSVFLAKAFTPVVGDWNMFSLTRSGDTFTFYANGASLGTASSSVAIGDAAAELTIGQAQGLGYLDGRIDDVRIYNHALSATDVGDLYNPVPEPFTMGLSALAFAAAARRRLRKSA